MRGTFSIWYLGVFGEPVLFSGCYTRRSLREALAAFRRYAHRCTWNTVWLLKRERKIIARIPSGGRGR